MRLCRTTKKMAPSITAPQNRNTPAYSSVSRKRMVRNERTWREAARSSTVDDPLSCFMPSTSYQPIPYADHGFDDCGIAELASQGHDRDPHGVGEGIGVLVPH